MEERLSGALQENVLTLLCFDTSAAAVIRNTVDAALFESQVYQEIASRAIAFFDQYTSAIGEHLSDVLEDILNGKDTRKANLFSRTIRNLHAAYEGINREYVISQLSGFIHQQQLKQSILKAVEHIEAGRVDDAELALEEGRKSRVTTFEPGTLFSDPLQSLRFIDNTADETFPLGVKELDERGIGPRRKEIMLFIAPAKKGKSWAMVHIAKTNIFNRKKVLVISLEMSEERYAQRFIQSIFAIGKNEAKVALPMLRTDELGRFLGVDIDSVTRRTLQDEGIKEYLTESLKVFDQRPPLRIKQFPTRSLTITHLKAYLDTLERVHKFVPDLLIIDYPDLMKVGSENLRVDLGHIFQDIRGLCVERNIAGVCPTQSNRASTTAKLVDDSMVTEDYSKIMTADGVITYSQTPEEKRSGLARLFVSNMRNDEDKFAVLIAQAYKIGQFCLDSVMMTGDYWDRLSASTARNQDDDDDND